MNEPQRTLGTPRGLRGPDGRPAEGIEGRWSAEFAGAPAGSWTHSEIESAVSRTLPEEREDCMRDLVCLAMSIAGQGQGQAQRQEQGKRGPGS